MKIVYNYYTPLDGAGTLINPAYKWRVDERTELCHHISQAGNLFYMMSSQGYVIHSIEVEKIKRIEVDSLVIDCTYNRADVYPFHALLKRDGKYVAGFSANDFNHILEKIRIYKQTIQ